MVGIADEAEMAESPLEQVGRGQPPDRDVVDSDSGERQIGQDPGDIDDRLAGLDQGFGQIVIEDMGDHPVVAQRPHRTHGPRLGRDRREDPVRPGLGEGLDAPQDVSVVVQAVSEDQSDPRRVSFHVRQGTT